MAIQFIIKGASKKNVYKGARDESWYVMHPQNDAILAYCKTEAEADKVIRALDLVASMVE